MDTEQTESYGNTAIPNAESCQPEPSSGNNPSASVSADMSSPVPLSPLEPATTPAPQAPLPEAAPLPRLDPLPPLESLPPIAPMTEAVPASDATSAPADESTPAPAPELEQTAAVAEPKQTAPAAEPASVATSAPADESAPAPMAELEQTAAVAEPEQTAPAPEPAVEEGIALSPEPLLNDTNPTVWNSFAPEQISDLPPADRLQQSFDMLILPQVKAGEYYRHLIRCYTRSNGFRNKYAIRSVSFLNANFFSGQFVEDKGYLIIEGTPEEKNDIKLIITYHLKSSAYPPNTLNQVNMKIPVLPEPAYACENSLRLFFTNYIPKLSPAREGKEYLLNISNFDALISKLSYYVTNITISLENSCGLGVALTENTLTFYGTPLQPGSTKLHIHYQLNTRLQGPNEKDFTCQWIQILPDPALQQEQEFYQQLQKLPATRITSTPAWADNRPPTEQDRIADIVYPLPFIRSFSKLTITDFVLDAPDLAIESSPDHDQITISGIARTLSESRQTPRLVNLYCHYQLQHPSGNLENRSFAVPILNITPNPKDLWKNLPVDPNAPYQSPDTDHQCILAEKTVLAASKRGRSHAHEGKFRDDNFKAEYFPETGWYIIAVSDGAGSAIFSREGSRIACQTFCDYLKSRLASPETNDKLLAMSNEDQEKVLKNLVLKAAYEGLINIDNEARASNNPRKLYAATFLGYIMKKINGEWLIVSIGIGDGIIALFDSNQQLMLLSEPDGGEFVGQTRFITMNEVWNDNPTKRAKAVRLPDFTFIMSMSDGVSDPKFETDNNLNNQQIWNDLWQELQTALPMAEHSEATAAALENWLDFWAVANHDDRTITIVY